MKKGKDRKEGKIEGVERGDRIEVVYFDIEDDQITEQIGLGVQIYYNFHRGDCSKRTVVKTITNNPILLFNHERELEEHISLIGKNDYHFRKGLGYVGEVYRLRYQGKEGKKYVFQLFEKEGNRLKISTDRVLVVDSQELRFIYPLVLAPDLKDDGFCWGRHYIIFPYNYGAKEPIEENKLKEIAPNLYNYLSAHKDKIEKQSQYNKRIQYRKIFYALIRVGSYCYGRHFVAIRDNMKLNACYVGLIKTDWEEEKTPLFDGHISYVNVSSKEEAEYVVGILRKKEVETIIKNLYDNRSISSRLPINIPKYQGVGK